MPASPEPILFPRLHSGFRSNPSLHGAPRLIRIDPSPSLKTIVLVVSGDAIRVGSLTHFFSTHSIDVKAFRTAKEFMTTPAPDVTACVILDLNLPDCSGLEVQSRISGRQGPPVVFVAAGGDFNAGVDAMKSGAIDFVLEPLDYTRLLAAVQTAFAQDLRARHERVERSSLLCRWGSLTPREQDVLQFTAAGFLNKQAAAELGITENTFQVHRGRVMRKMKADSLADLVRMATRLDSIARSAKRCEFPTQSLKAILQVLVEKEWEAFPAAGCGRQFRRKRTR